MAVVGAELLARIERAVDRTIQMALALPRNVAGYEIGRQVVRSSGSVGANLEEGQATLSCSEFAYRVSISLREARETLYWIRRIAANELLPRERLHELLGEWDELVAILTSIQLKLKRQRRDEKTKN